MTSLVTTLCIVAAILALGVTVLRRRQSQTARPDPALAKGFAHPAAPAAKFGHVQKFTEHDEAKAVAAAKRAAQHEHARRKLAAQASKPQQKARRQVESIRRVG